MIFVSSCTKTLLKSAKIDTFHNLVFGIDKRFIFYIIDPRRSKAESMCSTGFQMEFSHLSDSVIRIGVEVNRSDDEVVDKPKNKNVKGGRL